MKRLILDTIVENQTGLSNRFSFFTLLKTVSSAYLYDTTINEGIVNAKLHRIRNLLGIGKTLDGGLAVDVIPDLLRLVLLPFRFHESGSDGIDRRTRVFKELHQVLGESQDGRL